MLFEKSGVLYVTNVIYVYYNFHPLTEVNDESNICKFFRKRSGCWRGERCPFRHVVPQQGESDMNQVGFD